MTIAPEELASQETWETTTGGSTYLLVKDPRVPNAWKRKKVGGRGTKRVTLTVEERLHNEELVNYENEDDCPFRNGMLVRIAPKTAERGQFEITDDELLMLLADPDDDAFDRTLAKTQSEIIVRRLFGLAEKHATMHRYRQIEQVIADRYSVGKTSTVAREAMADDARYAKVDF